jgi:hypothetical protein
MMMLGPPDRLILSRQRRAATHISGAENGLFQALPTIPEVCPNPHRPTLGVFHTHDRQWLARIPRPLLLLLTDPLFTHQPGNSAGPISHLHSRVGLQKFLGSSLSVFVIRAIDFINRASNAG